LNNYLIFETKEFQKKFSKIPETEKSFFRKKLKHYIYPQLRSEPHYGNNIKKLIDYNPETWRYRIGNYRLFYVINENENSIYMLTINLRKDAY